MRLISLYYPDQEPIFGKELVSVIQFKIICLNVIYILEIAANIHLYLDLFEPKITRKRKGKKQFVDSFAQDQLHAIGSVSQAGKFCRECDNCWKRKLKHKLMYRSNIIIYF